MYTMLTYHIQPNQFTPSICGADTKAGEGNGAWLAEMLAALLVRAAEVEPSAAPEPAPAAWAAAWAAFFPLLACHLQTLQVPAVASLKHNARCWC